MSKQVRVTRKLRRHFISEWCAARGMSKADLARAVDADKSQSTRWFEYGQMPQPKQQIAIAGALGIKPEHLLRHPQTVWMEDFLEGRPEDEVKRIRRAMEIGWPKIPS